MELHAFDELAEFSALPEEPKPVSVFPPVTPPGMAYVPYQQWGKTFEAEKGFCRGTMFPVLDDPFEIIGGDCTR